MKIAIFVLSLLIFVCSIVFKTKQIKSQQENELVTRLDSITQCWLVTYTSIYNSKARIHLHKTSPNNYEGVFEQIMERNAFGEPTYQHHSSTHILLRNDSIFLKFQAMDYWITGGAEPGNYCEFIALLKEPLENACYRIRRDYAEYIDSYDDERTNYNSIIK